MTLYDIVSINCDIMQINPESVKKYLISHNWKNIHTYPDGVSTLWQKRSLTVRHIPDKEMYSDYSQILSQLLRTVAYSEKINIVSLIKELDNSIEVNYGFTICYD